MKRLLSLFVTLTLVSLLFVPLNINADNSSFVGKEEFAKNSNGFITEDWSKIDYISIDEYIEKYGGENAINRAFNEGEKKNKAMLLSAAGKEQQAAALLSENKTADNTTNDLLLSIKSGEFLGMEILSISDLPPDDINLSVRVNREGALTPAVMESAISNTNISPSTITPRANLVKNGTHSDGSAYTIYYSSQYPSDTDINNTLYEPESGSYFYKYGYSWKGDYRCTAELTFENTELHRGTQEIVGYAFIGATTDNNAVGGAHSVDFGLMANPSDSYRNDGLYAFWTFRGIPTNVDMYPKVLIDEDASTSNTMVLEDKTIKLQLTIDTLGNVETVMYEGSSMICYKTENVTGFVSGNNESLSFFEAMSCVDKEGANTYPDSGAHFTNVLFSDTKLYSYNSGERAFGTYGDNTYCVYICKPNNISYTNGSNSEMVSIIYDDE